MPLRPSEVADTLADLSTRFTATSLAATAASRTTPTADQLEALRADLAGLEADARGLARELDLVDELDYLLVEDGPRTIGLWRWRRATRRGVLGFWRLCHRTAEIAQEISGGQRARVVVTREGDTWQSIALRELGDWTAWPRLLAANPHLDAGVLATGITLIVPPPR